MAIGKRARKINYFDIIPDNITEKILTLTIPGNLKDIGSIRRVLDSILFLLISFTFFVQ